MATRDPIGDLANISQLTGLNAIQLISLIIRSANTARTHKRNCRRFANHLRLISNLLQQLNIPDLRDRSETREPLESLEEAIRRGYVLVEGCGRRSFLYMMAMGWSVTYEFKRVQDEIDRCLKIVPLISLVHSKRAMEKLDYIEKDQCEYMLEEEDKKVQEAIQNHDASKKHSKVLEKSLSKSYPDLKFEEALKTEKEKLKIELHRSQANLDTSQCEVIHHLLQVTHGVKMDGICENRDYDVNYNREFNGYDVWNSDLLACCQEPSLCLRTFFWPCGTFSKIASFAKNRHMWWIFDDFLSHLMCCCCALVQEWREIEIRATCDPDGIKNETNPPERQYMDS